MQGEASGLAGRAAFATFRAVIARQTSQVLYCVDCHGFAQLEHTVRSVSVLPSAEKGGFRSASGTSPFLRR